MSRARFVWLLAVAAVLAGFLPALLFALGSLLPHPEATLFLSLFPDLSWRGELERWLFVRRVHWTPPAGLLFALPGLALMYVGAAIARSRRAAIEAMRMRAQDARRRVRQYEPMERIEPTLGPADWA